ncbi:MAG: ArsB/NhaD family transporter [Candidatus Saliniplasma sp.]
MRTAAIGAIVIFAISYYGIVSKRIHRTIAAMSGAVGMLLFGHGLGFYDSHVAIGYIDFNTIGLLLGMMILVGLLGDTGFFKYIAIKAAKASEGSYYRLLAFFVLVTAFTSAFLDNVTTILLIAPITITIAKEMDINPIPFLIAGIMSANIGGTATLIGDPPNVIISSATGINFNEFILYLAPIVIIILFVILLVFEYIFKDVVESDIENFSKIAKLDESRAITNKPLLNKALLVLFITILLFLVHHIIGIEPWLVAITGATLLLILSLTDPEEALTHVHWTTLLFFASKFILIGGLEQAGIIRMIAFGMVNAAGESIILSIFIVLMVSGISAIIIGNIPAVIALIPAVDIFIEQSILFGEFAVNPLWWALSLGVCLGGNGTLISSHTNMIVSSISDKMGYPLSYWKYTKTALPITFLSLFTAFLLLVLFFVIIL